MLYWLALSFQQPFLITNEGLTTFKVTSEYIIIGLYLLAIIYYLRATTPLPSQVRSLILLSLVLTIFAELSFTLYTDYAGIAFVVGHLIKFLSFWTIYLAIVRTTLNEPFDLLSRVSTSYNAIPQPTIILDNNAQIVQVNKATTDITKISAAELVHQPIHNLFHNDDVPEENCELCQAIKRGKGIESQTVWSSNLKRWFLISLAPMFYGEKSGGMVQSASDITQQKSAEQALRQSQKMDAIGQLTGGIAHDFNNILGIILGNIQLLEMQSNLDEKSSARFKAIQKATNRATDLTKQLLGFSRGKSQHINIVNINHLITEMDNLINRSLTPQIEVEYSLSESLENVNIDAGQFQDALLNLVLNARDAMNNTGRLVFETRNCTLDAAYCNIHSTLKPGKYVQLIISDNGSGMTHEQLDHIFEPFFTTKSVSKGTGLGLAMVYGFVKNCKGAIEVFSEKEYGSSFKLYFPQIEGNLTPESLPGETTLEAIPHGSEIILVVDDEEALLGLAEESLQALGYTVFTAANGPKALEILANNFSIELLFSDIVMPGGINGYQLAEQAVQLKSDLKILLTSGYTGNTTATVEQKLFARNLLTKPYTQAEMANLIRKTLKG